MKKLSRKDLMSLEEYAQNRPELRKKLMAHKKKRRLVLNDHASLHFEDRLSMQYQVQEMLRIEKIFEPDEIQSELDAYNPLIPDGSNWKATFMLEYADIEERKKRLAELIGIEDRVWIQVEGFDRVYAIADEDLEREDATKTSAVHFLRFEFSPDMIAAIKQGRAVKAGIDHDHFQVEVSIPAKQLAYLAADFD